MWTSRQRQANSIHEISYRACFKPQLPAYFIERLTREGDVVYDPFSGRGTTAIEAALRGRGVAANDVNPLSVILTKPRLELPSLADIDARLRSLKFAARPRGSLDLSMFFHPDTEHEILGLREYLYRRQRSGEEDSVDRWIRMVATNRLTGHSPGFFSVYTLPPNQAVSARSQAKINARRQQSPPPRDVPGIIRRKTRALLRDVTAARSERLARVARQSRIVIGSSARTPTIESESVALAVTSPPFLDVVDYRTDNWLRCWFSGIEASAVPVTLARDVATWSGFVTDTLREVRRVLRPGGHVAFEVGEVRGGALRLEESVIPAGVAAGLEPILVIVNAQQFTKTANCWGVSNNRKGTNTNRIVLFRRGQEPAR
jgi:hypothetical protein